MVYAVGMKYVGILGLLATLILGVWLVSGAWQTPRTPSETDSREGEGSSTSSHGDALDRARDAAGQMGGTVATVEVYEGITVPIDAVTLDLRGQNLTGSLKAEVNQLTKIEVLDLSGNQFTGVPAEVGQLRTLRVLNLSNNPITGLPYEIGNLSRLEKLDLRGTQYAKSDLDTIRQQLPNTTNILTD